MSASTSAHPNRLARASEAGEVHDAARLCSFLSDAGVREVKVQRLRCVPEALLTDGKTA